MSPRKRKKHVEEDVPKVVTDDRDAPFNLRQLTLDAYAAMVKEPEVAHAAYGVAAMIIQQAMRCRLRVACYLLDAWLKDAGL